MGFPRNFREHSRNVSAPAKAPNMPLRHGKRPSVVDGKVLEPEWDRVPQTYGSFNQDTLARISQVQAEHARTARPTTQLPHSQRPPPENPPRSSCLNYSACMDSASPRQPFKRYYSSALSDEDRTALAVGELNHNLRGWTGDKLIQYHVSRIELVPYSEERQEIIAEILDEKRGGERFVLQSARQAKRFVSSPLSKLQTFKEVKTHNEQMQVEASRSMVDLRAANTSSLLLSPISPISPVSPPSSTSQEGFPFPVLETQNIRQSTHSGASSNGDHFSRQSVSSSMMQFPHTSDSSRDSSHNRGHAPDRRPLVRRADRNTSRFRSSMALEAMHYVVNADITFDTFLAPHASGKGETHCESVHIKKEVQPRNFSRRLSKMPSTPQLKKRAS
ncbi:hypothetical protein PSPO01_04816 [Paraphaeosphaeria sporulosa]